MNNNDIVQKLWNLCDVLRDDGINYSDYVTELVMLLFLKMVHERVEADEDIEDEKRKFKHRVPESCTWSQLQKESGIALLDHYKRILLVLSTGKDANGEAIHNDHLISAIYADASTRLREPKHLEQIIKTLDQIDWFSDNKDGFGDLYEGLLEKNASETKSGAGQYFTPRALIKSIVHCMQPQAGEVVQDPSAGTAGFLIAADTYIKARTDDLYDLTDQQQDFQKTKAYVGVELVPSTRRLALMNCLLHGMEGDEQGVVQLGNALGEAGKSLPSCDVILANPPFGTAKGGEASITRDDLTFDTSNKQLAFLQHIYRNLKAGGRAAVVLPDNVLFEAGKGTDIRKDLMDKCNLHTILRLPTGIFYAQGVKTNVLFFTKGTQADKFQEEGCTQNVWVFDLRTNMPSFGKRTPFGDAHLKPFESVYGDNVHGYSERQEGEYSFVDEKTLSEATEEDKINHSRWRCFSRDWIADTKGDSLDISWLKDKDAVDAANLPEPKVLAQEAKAELTQALSELDGLMAALASMEVGDE